MTELRKGLIKTLTGITTTKAQFRKLFNRINTFGDCNYDLNTNIAIVSFNYKGKQYEKRSSKQKTARDNLRVLYLWLKGRIINMERGIEDFNEAFSPYVKLEGSVIQTEQIQTPFSFFGLSEDCSQNELEREAKRQLFLWHPDRHNGDVIAEERFKEINKMAQEARAIKGWTR